MNLDLTLDLTLDELKYLNYLINIRTDDLLRAYQRNERLGDRYDPDHHYNQSQAEAYIALLRSLHDKILPLLIEL